MQDDEPPDGFDDGGDDGSDEAALIGRARRDLTAFAPLYDRYFDPIYGFCLRRLLDREAAADATSQTFAQAMARLDAFHGGSFRAWLFTIARNVVVDAVRRRRPTVTLDGAVAAELVDPDLTPEDRAVAAEEHRRLLLAIQRLTPDQRGIVELRLAGLSGSEIAETLGIRPGSVHSGQYRAFRALRRLLADDPQPGAPR